MADQRQFRFRLPWLSAATAPPPRPTPEPEAPPPTTEIRAPPRPMTTISIQRPPFRPVVIAPPPPSVVLETPTVQPPATQQRLSPPRSTTESQPKSPVRTQRPGSVPPSPTRTLATESKVASLPATEIEPKISPQPPPIPDSLSKSRSFVPVEELKLSEPRTKDNIASPKTENQTQPQQKLSSVSEKLKSEAVNDAPARFSPFSREPEETVTERKTIAPVSEDHLRNRVAELLSSVASTQANGITEKEEIGEMKNNPTKVNEKFMGSSSHSRRKASSEFRHKAAMSNGGEQTPFHREIKEDIFKLIQKLSHGQIKSPIGEHSASIVTLSGKNMGATMDFGGNPDESTNDGERIKKRMSSNEDEEHQPGMAYVNSNTQSINNSILLESVVNGRDPGVHLSLSNNQPDFKKSTIDDDEIWAHKAEFSLTPANNLTHEPQVRTRCLRGPFLETTDSDPDNPYKPQRHGCIDRDIEIL
ncbi:hypothetical protein LINPERHAP1_LOCUS34488 [Linum perenne]